MTVWSWFRRNCGGFNIAFRDEMIPLMTAISIFVFISLQDGISIHPRYILSVLPFLYIFASKTVRNYATRNRIEKTVVTIILGVVVVSSMSQYPYSMSYFIEIAGGIKGGPRHLLGSNADWEQSKYFFCDWCHNHSDEMGYVKVLSDDKIERHMLKNVQVIEFEVNNDNSEFPFTSSDFSTGYYALSVNDIFDGDKKFAPFRELAPIKRIGASIWIYRVNGKSLSESETNRKQEQ